MFSRCYKTSFSEQFTTLLDRSRLTQHEKDIIKARYVTIVVSTERKNALTNFMFYLLTNVVTITCVLVSSLVSLEKASVVAYPAVVFWLIWSFSLVMLLANKWLYTFNIHKKYILNSSIIEKLYAEGWCFLAGAGKYNVDDKSLRFNKFIVRIERLKLKYVETISGLDSGDGGNSGDLNNILYTPRLKTDSTDSCPKPNKEVVIQIDADRIPTKKQRRFFESDGPDSLLSTRRTGRKIHESPPPATLRPTLTIPNNSDSNNLDQDTQRDNIGPPSN
jgi:hypothetical protein